MPRVSVIIPNYNHARYLDRRITSVLEQTFRDTEVFILDDASSDDSLKVIEKYARQERVKVFPNERNSGSVFKQWNKGVRMAQGDYVWIAESDDDAEPQLLESLVRLLDADPGMVLAYCQSMVIDGQGVPSTTVDKLYSYQPPQRWQSNFTNEGSDECARFLTLRNSIPNASAVVFRRRAFMDAGAAEENMRMCGDWMTWARICLQGRVGYLATPLNRFRRHGRSVCATTTVTVLCRESGRIRSFIGSRVKVTKPVRTSALKEMLGTWTHAIRQDEPMPDFQTAWLLGGFASQLGWNGRFRVLFLYLVFRFSFRTKLGKMLHSRVKRLQGRKSS